MTYTVPGIRQNGLFPKLSGHVAIPASKSHTVRALLIAAFAPGTSRIRRPLESRDAQSCREAIVQLGAQVCDDGPDWLVQGIRELPAKAHINVGNSGTTLYLATALAALGSGEMTFDGDEQIRRRSAAPLLNALEKLGARITSNQGCAPYTIQGPIQPAAVEVACPVSQYLSALLMAAPLMRRNEAHPHTQIHVTELNEAPYVGLTLDWLDKHRIEYTKSGWEQFIVPSGQCYQNFDAPVPADWSSAAFFMAAAAVTQSTLILQGPDPEDSQGDKAVADMLKIMGCQWEPLEEGIRFSGRPLRGADLDLNATPDALPALAVVGAFAQGTTRLLNVPQARQKETDRIAVMAKELGKLGIHCEELSDGLVIHGVGNQDRSKNNSVSGISSTQRSNWPQGTTVQGHDDHRVVMALAVAGLMCQGETSILGAQAADVTFPGFFQLLESIRK
ncbi:MAG: 3-phosphoshikimate 1-carboxyvinyltransferase [Spirochaetales bacterium]|nr:3-phosphoshikimate 1-carboxyvinyltransferase [Spirochaetales bacterium]